MRQVMPLCCFVAVRANHFLKHRMSSLALKLSTNSAQQLDPNILFGQRNLSKTDVSPLIIYIHTLLLLLVMEYIQSNFALQRKGTKRQLHCHQLQLWTWCRCICDFKAVFFSTKDTQGHQTMKSISAVTLPTISAFPASQPVFLLVMTGDQRYSLRWHAVQRKAWERTGRRGLLLQRAARPQVYAGMPVVARSPRKSRLQNRAFHSVRLGRQSSEDACIW